MIKKFWSYYKDYKSLFLLDFGSAIIHGLLELAFPVAITFFIENILSKSDLSLIIEYGFILLLIYLLNAGLSYIVSYWGHKLGISIETEMRRQAFDHLQKLSFSFYDKEKTGRLLTKVTKDLEQVGELAHHGPEDIFIAAMTMIGAVVIMFWLNLQFALIMVIIAPILIWITTLYGRKMEASWQNIIDGVSRFNSRVEDNIGGIRVVQAFTNEDYEKNLFEQDNKSYKNSKLTAYRYMATGISMLYFGSRLVQILAMVIGSYYVINNELSSASFVGFILLSGVFTKPIETIIAVLESYTNGIAGFRRFLDFLAIKPDIVDDENAIILSQASGFIRYSNVSFSYKPGGPCVLNHIHFQIKPGENVAFVGSSGAGKTTLCSLLPRFYELTSGTIYVDEIDINKISIKSLRKNIGVVQQDTFLFSSTIRENISYGNLEATEDDIIEAAQKAHIWHFIDSQPDGLDTIVGERGTQLSTGQRQRISIARIFLKNPPIVIFDEATSSLDTVTEKDIQTALFELSVGRTTLTITHRLSAIRHFDRILVIENGEVVEDGSHSNLMTQQGTYSKFINM